MIHLAIFLIGMVFGILSSIATMMFVMDKLIPDDSKDYAEQEERTMHQTKCEKCKKLFQWNEKDALVKYKYGSAFIVHCPHCDRLTKAYIEEEEA